MAWPGGPVRAVSSAAAGSARKPTGWGCTSGDASGGIRLLTTWDHAEVEIARFHADSRRESPLDPNARFAECAPAGTTPIDVDGETVLFNVFRNDPVWFASARIGDRTVVLTGDGDVPADLALTRIGPDHPMLLDTPR